MQIQKDNLLLYIPGQKYEDNVDLNKILNFKIDFTKYKKSQLSFGKSIKVKL